jgi:hypothetical protein
MDTENIIPFYKDHKAKIVDCQENLFALFLRLVVSEEMTSRKRLFILLIFAYVNKNFLIF